MRCTRCCEDMDIKLEHLIFPDRMSDVGQEFCAVHGLTRARLFDLQQGAMDLGEGLVKLKHRCAKLTKTGRCAIYETRPQICRDFQCFDNPECRPEKT